MQEKQNAVEKEGSLPPTRSARGVTRPARHGDKDQEAPGPLQSLCKWAGSQLSLEYQRWANRHRSEWGPMQENLHVVFLICNQVTLLYGVLRGVLYGMYGTSPAYVFLREHEWSKFMDCEAVEANPNRTIRNS